MLQEPEITEKPSVARARIELSLIHPCPATADEIIDVIARTQKARRRELAELVPDAHFVARCENYLADLDRRRTGRARLPNWASERDKYREWVGRNPPEPPDEETARQFAYSCNAKTRAAERAVLVAEVLGEGWTFRAAAARAREAARRRSSQPTPEPLEREPVRSGACDRSTDAPADHRDAAKGGGVGDGVGS
jgi:hypothetical protein